MKLKQNNRIRTVLLCSLAGFLVSSCSDSDIVTQYVEGTANSDPGVSMPQALQRANLPTNGSLAAFLTVDPDSGGQPQAMSINNNVASFTGEIPSGERDLNIEINFESESFGTVPLVSARKTVTVSSNTPIDFTEIDYSYADTDGDESTNIRELEVGSNPNNSGSTPTDFDDNYEDNDSLNTAYDLSALENVFLHNPAEPGNLTGGNLGQGYLVANDSVTDGFDYFSLTPPAGKSALNLQIAVTVNTWVSFFYFDSGGNSVTFDRINDIDNGNDDIIAQVLTFDNPPDTTFYVVFLTDEDGNLEELGDHVNGGYTLSWWTE